MPGRRSRATASRSHMAVTEDERLPRGQLVAEQLDQPRMPPFGHARGLSDRGLLFRVIVDVEVLGPRHAEVERLVPDFVGAEVLRLRVRRQQQRRGGEDTGRERSVHVCVLPGEALRDARKAYTQGIRSRFSSFLAACNVFFCSAPRLRPARLM